MGSGKAGVGGAGAGGACAVHYGKCEGLVTFFTIGAVQRGPCRKRPLPQFEHGYVRRYLLLEENRRTAHICAKCLSLLRDLREMSGAALEVVAKELVDFSDDSYYGSTAVYETYDEETPLVCEECLGIVYSPHRGFGQRAPLN